MRFAVVILLVILGACNREPLEITEPNLSIDWQQYLFKDERPVDEHNYPTCDSLPVIDNPEHPESYDFAGRIGTVVAEVIFPSENPHYAIYSRSTPVNGVSGPYLLEVILLNLKTGETKVLGETTGSPHIGGDYVIFPNRYEFVIYQISTGRLSRMGGDIYEINISPKGEYVHFISNSNTGIYEKRGSFIYQIDDWKLVHKTVRDSIGWSAWISDQELVFTRSIDQYLYSFNLESKKSDVFAGPFQSHFRVFTGLSSDHTRAYGYQTYTVNLISGEDRTFHHVYDGESCQTRDYGTIYPLPDGRLLVSRYYYPIDHEKKTVSIINEMRLFDADGTNERAVTLLLK